MTPLRRLAIHNFRGLREQAIDLEGKSLVVFGPNGSGKSSVVDALDFLLTGRVRRLEGEGAGGLSLEGHGKHIDAPLEDAWVEGTFMVRPAGAKQPGPVVVRRTLHPAALSPAVLPEPLDRLFSGAARLGNHVLSRREVLKFVIARPQTRRDLVALLLDVGSVDRQRKEMTGAAKDARAAEETARAGLLRAERALFDLVTPPAGDVAAFLLQVNAVLARVGVRAVDKLEAVPRAVPQSGPESQAGDVALQGLKARVPTVEEALARLVPEVRAYLAGAAEARGTQAHLAAAEKQMLEAALHLASGERCPLCETELELAGLHARWHARLAALDRVGDTLGDLRARRTELLRQAQRAAQEAEAIGAAAAIVGELAGPCARLRAAGATLAGLVLPEPLDAHPPGLEVLTSAVASASSSLVAIRRVLDGIPAPSDSTQARAALSAICAKLVQRDRAATAAAHATSAARFLARADKVFVAERDRVLDAIHDGIAGRVEALFASIIPSDLPRRTKLSSTRAGLDLEIDFHGRGGFPPTALHSEGQQDMLGICMFLALAERTAGGKPSLLVLDDVLMSVDAQHRRAVAEVLRKEYPSCQFIITTHDAVWAKQLRGLGVTPRSMQFGDWSLEGASQAGDPGAAFQRARSELAAGAVPTAAHTLRRALEVVLPDMCEALGGRVRYSPGRPPELGDFFEEVKNRLKDLLAEHKKAEASWGKDVTSIDTLARDYQLSRERVDKEQWSVNAAVHHNAWAQMTREDFAPVVEAYEAFIRFFECASCRALLRLEERGKTKTALRCACGSIFRNLEARPKG